MPDSPLPIPPIQPSHVAGLLGPLSSRFRIEACPTIDSTSSEIRRRGGGDIDGLVIAAETQTAGRGRQGRHWVDRPGGSLLFSLGWRMPGTPVSLAGLSLAVGVAVCAAFERQGVPQTQLKWPNDILFRYCKLGGILVETLNQQAGSIDLIIGVGINIRLDASARDSIAAPVTDLQAAGWTGSRDELLAAILRELAPMLDRFAREGFQPFRASWLARHALQQRNVMLWSAGEVVAAGKAVDLDDDGALLLQTASGVRRFISGELTLRPD